MSDAKTMSELILRIALNESLKLQSHYAALLNAYDGGKRREFTSSEEWIARLRETGALTDDER